MQKRKYCIATAGTSFLTTEGLKAVFNRDGRFKVEHTATTPEQLVDAISHQPIDLVILDANHQDFSGPKLSLLRKNARMPAILLLLESVTRKEFQRYAEDGFENLVLKNAQEQEILNSADSAVNQKKYYSSSIVDMILESIESQQPDVNTMQLTSSEKEIVRLIAKGLTTKEIAVRRNISFHTVNTHRKNIFRKLEVTNASELIMKAIRAGWIDNIEYYI